MGDCFLFRFFRFFHITNELVTQQAEVIGANVGSLSAHRLRCWLDSDLTLFQCPGFVRYLLTADDFLKAEISETISWAIPRLDQGV